MEGHSMVGMAVIINEAPDRHNPPPKGMQKCGNFSWSLGDFYKIMNITDGASFSNPIQSAESAYHEHQNTEWSLHNQVMNEIPSRSHHKPRPSGITENTMTRGSPHLMVCETLPLDFP